MNSQHPAKLAGPLRITLAFTGASGMPYGLRLLECLLTGGAEVHVIYSAAAQIVMRQECSLALPAQPREAERVLRERCGAGAGAGEDRIVVHGRDDWLAPMASGSNPGDGMAICPCTMGTLGAVAGGLADNLIERAADVMLKERRTLIVVPRETPLGLVHLENLTQLARLGALVLPAMPAFYGKPASLDDAIDTVVGRILDHLGLEHDLLRRWGAR